MKRPGAPCYWEDSGAKLGGAEIVEIYAEEEGPQ